MLWAVTARYCVWKVVTRSLVYMLSPRSRPIITKKSLILTTVTNHRVVMLVLYHISLMVDGQDPLIESGKALSETYSSRGCHFITITFRFFKGSPLSPSNRTCVSKITKVLNVAK